VRASPLIVADVTGQDAAQVSLAENENVIQALAPDRADAPLHSPEEAANYRFPG